MPSRDPTRRIAAQDTPRIAILSERNLFREGLLEILHKRGHPSIIEATTVAELIEQLERQPLALVLIDLEQERDDPRETLRQIRAVSPDTSIVMIGTTLQNAALARAADGWLESPEADGAGLDRMAGAADRPHVGRLHFRPSARLAQERQTWDRLTVRQEEVIELLAEGADNRRIAAALGITERAVKAHVGALLKRFKAGNRTEIAVLAARAGLRRSAGLN
jgi:DNA-binding NarL/FixJ family response regulator